MKASKAVEIAKNWVEQEAIHLPGFRAAHLSGSLSQLSGDQDLPDYSDIDVYCVMEDEHCFSQRKFRYQDALLETVSYPLSAYRSPEAVLSHPHLAHNFIEDNSILADPERLLETIHRVVKEEFAQPRWLQARYRQAKSNFLAVVDDAGNAKTLNAGFPFLFRTLRLLSNLVLIAHLQAPTVRTVLSRAKRVLAQSGHAFLSDELLRVLGSERFSTGQVQSCLSRCVEAFDRAVECRIPSSPDFNLDPAVRPYLIEGSEEMIHSGDHREALLWIAVMHWTANQALQNDAPEGEKPRWQESINRLYAELGLKGMRDFSQRMDDAKRVAGEAITLTDGIVFPTV
jgi:hypothetical protein